MRFFLKSSAERKVTLSLKQIDAHIARWLPGTEFIFEVTRKKKLASDPMRRYYWAVVLPVFLEAYGYDPDDADTVHRHLKILFFGVKPDDHGIYLDKEIPSVFGDKSDVEVPIKWKFTEWVIRKSAEEGHYTPDPGEDMR